MPPDRRWRLDLKTIGQALAGLGLRPASATAGPSPLVAFHCHDGLDHAGRDHAALIGLSDQAMHEVHDFIQWLFPLPEPSLAFDGAPVLSEADIAAMRASAVCQARHAAARARFVAFLTDNPVWLRAYDHNHLRITRVIRSTRLIAGHEAADELRDHILGHARDKDAWINPTTLAFWVNA
jgi:hypothetical protein